MAADRLEQLEARTRYEPTDVEDRVFARWLEAGIFSPEPEGDASENFSIAVPPPNVTGALHMGHALNGTIQDLLIRINRMKGRRTKWIFGTDHAGIATQIQVERQLESEGTSRAELGREAFTERVWEWKAKYGGEITRQIRRGTSHRGLVETLSVELDRDATSSRPAALLEPLSEREQRVLSYLETMLSTEEIAGELFVSTNTVKSHVKSIYRKLGVTRRRQAVLRARTLQLL